jgi:hypothetical protein
LEQACKSSPLTLLFLLIFTLTGMSQTLVAISPQQCIYRAGDDLRWAAPDLDQAGWLPYTEWKINSRQPRMWIRCQADLSSLENTVDPAIQVNLEAAYQLFLHGSLAGASGNVENGGYTESSIQTFPIRLSGSSPQRAVIAVRVTYREAHQTDPIQIFAGPRQWLGQRRDSLALAGSSGYMPIAICFGVIGVVGFMLLGLYLNDRGRLELLLLAIVCWGLAILRLNEYCGRTLVPFSSTLHTALFCIGQTLILPYMWLMFRLGRKPVPWLFRILVAIGLSYPLQVAVTLFLPAGLSLRLDSVCQPILPVFLVVGAMLTLAPLVAFWPWSQIPGRMRALAAFTMLWGLVDTFWFAAVISDVTTSAGRVFFERWHSSLLELRATATMSVIIALLALLFREQRKTAEERALLAGEMQAAQQIQRMLVQPEIKTLSGLKIDVAFRPMREVGGDFYLCRLLAGNRQRVILGDVSGKGAAAAMTAALLIGAAERRDHDSPSELLQHMSLVLCDAQVGGFATCVCADFADDGRLVLANAGHLLPWRNGEEVTADSGLPLGIRADVEYTEDSFNLAAGDMLTFVSDGVVEARDANGKLFGFERTQSISRESAQSIAETAQRFGQDDDITVLTLSFVTAHAMHS